MTSNIYRLTALVTVLAGAAVLPLAAQAAQPAQAQGVAATAADSLTVVRDADTGKLRAPTGAEAEELRGRAAADGRSVRSERAERTTLEPRAHRSGARGTRMTDESMHHTMIVRNADGSTSLQCFDSKGGMHAAHSGESSAPVSASPRAAAKLETE